MCIDIHNNRCLHIITYIAIADYFAYRTRCLDTVERPQQKLGTCVCVRKSSRRYMWYGRAPQGKRQAISYPYRAIYL